MSNGIPSFFKTPRHRTFDYKPLVYDERKERKEELERLAEESRTGEVSDERMKERLRAKLSDRWSGSSRKRQSSSQNMRLVLITAALVGLVWLFFNWV